MCVAQVVAAFVRLHFTRALQQHTGDDLQAVGDPVLDFLQQQLFVAHKVVLDLFGQPLRCHVGNRKDHADALGFEIVERMRVNQQAQRILAAANQIHFINIDGRIACNRCFQQRVELAHIPFTFAKFGQRPAIYCGAIKIEGLAKRIARRDDGQIFFEEHKRRKRRRYQRNRHIVGVFGQACH